MRLKKLPGKKVIAGKLLENKVLLLYEDEGRQ
jgi:hypothetical protein